MIEHELCVRSAVLLYGQRTHTALTQERIRRLGVLGSWNVEPGKGLSLYLF